MVPGFVAGAPGTAEPVGPTECRQIPSALLVGGKPGFKLRQVARKVLHPQILRIVVTGVKWIPRRKRLPHQSPIPTGDEVLVWWGRRFRLPVFATPRGFHSAAAARARQRTALRYTGPHSGTSSFK